MTKYLFTDKDYGRLDVRDTSPANAIAESKRLAAILRQPVGIWVLSFIAGEEYQPPVGCDHEFIPQPPHGYKFCRFCNIEQPSNIPLNPTAGDSADNNQSTSPAAG